MNSPNIARIDVEPVWIGSIPVHPVRLRDTLEFIDRVASSGSKATVFNANAHAVNLAGRNESFRDALRAASLVFCDGYAVKWAARVLGSPLPERYTPPDWIDALCGLAATKGYRLFFLGAMDGVAEAAARELRSRHSRLQITAHHGYFKRDSEEEQAILDQINTLQPHILMVGFGMPCQELWITKHLHSLNVRVVLPVGGLFDFVSGYKHRGPRWLTSTGLEWLTRLVHEPLRLGKRYLLGNPRFIWTVLRQALAFHAGHDGTARR